MELFFNLLRNSTHYILAMPLVEPSGEAIAKNKVCFPGYVSKYIFSAVVFVCLFVCLIFGFEVRILSNVQIDKCGNLVTSDRLHLDL